METTERLEGYRLAEIREKARNFADVIFKDLHPERNDIDTVEEMAAERAQKYSGYRMMSDHRKDYFMEELYLAIDAKLDSIAKPTFEEYDLEEESRSDADPGL